MSGIAVCEPSDKGIGEKHYKVEITVNPYSEEVAREFKIGHREVEEAEEKIEE